MPLVKITLENGIKNAIQQQMSSKQVKLALCKKLDGGPLAGKVSSAKNITKALGNIKLATNPILANTPDIPGASAISSQLCKKVSANEWANGISEAVYKWMDEDIVPILAKVIADEVTTYIKSATIIIPPGTVTTCGAGPGTVTAPSSPAQIN